MNKSLIFLIAVVLTGTFFCGGKRADRVLTAEVQERTLLVTLENKTGGDIWFWEMGNMWADGSFYLILEHRTTKKIKVSNFGQRVYTRHGPATQIIPTGGKAEFRLDLDEHQWSEKKLMLDESYRYKSLIFSPGLDDITISSGVSLDRLYFHFPNED